MKLQISFDMSDLNKALEIAEKIKDFADVFEIGSPLIYGHGLNALISFRRKFPEQTIFVDLKLVDRFNGVIESYAKEGADIISVLAGTSNKAIQKASYFAQKNNVKVALDLVDSYSLGQSAMDAKALDIDLIIFHGPHESTELLDLLEEWQNVKGNTDLPVFAAGGINRTNINKVLELKPNGIIIGSAITKSDDPAREAEFFRSFKKEV